MISMNMLKKIMIFLWTINAFALLLVMPTSAFLIEGSEKSIEVTTMKDHGTKYVPIISLCEAYGVSYRWDMLINKVTLYKKGKIISILFDDTFIEVNGEVKRVNTPPLLSNGSMMVPLDFYYADWWYKKEKKVIPFAKEKKITINTIIIDPGHGGKDKGAISKNQTKEKSIVLDFAKEISEQLNEQKINVLMTRDNDYFVTLSERVHMVNTTEADLLISIHANGHRDHRADGFEIYYYSDDKNQSLRAIEMIENATDVEDYCLMSSALNVNATLWDIILNENCRQSRVLAEEIQKNVKKHKLLKMRGVKEARFYVLKWIDKPAVLIELGFMSNDNDFKKMSDPLFRQKMCAAIVKGIIDFKHIYEKSKGFTT